MTLTRTLIATLTLLWLGACSLNPGQPLMIGTNLWPGYEPLYLAAERYQWDEDRLRLVEYPSTTEVLRAFRNRSIEAAALTLDEAIRLKEDGIPIKIILVNDFSDGADVILAKPPIHSVAQLKGKTVAVEGTALGAFFLDRALASQHLGLQDVKIRNTDVNLHVRAFNDKDVDAVVTFEPVRTLLLKQGATEIFNSSALPGEIVDVLVVHEEFAQQHPRVIKQLVDDWFRSLAYMQANQDDAYRFISSRTSLTIDELRQSYTLLHIPNREENIEMLQAGGAIEHTLQMLNQSMYRIRHTRTLIDTSNMCDNRFVL